MSQCFVLQTPRCGGRLAQRADPTISRTQLQLDRSAYERAPAQRKSPQQMCRAADADAFVCHTIDTRLSIRDKTVARIGAQIHLMISSGDCKGLREFARTGAEPTDITNAAASLHQFN